MTSVTSNSLNQSNDRGKYIQNMIEKERNGILREEKISNGNCLEERERKREK